MPDAIYLPGKEPPVRSGQEAGWASELFWTQRLEEKILPLKRSDDLGRKYSYMANCALAPNLSRNSSFIHV
jgi:hypothetical protein